MSDSHPPRRRRLLATRFVVAVLLVCGVWVYAAGTVLVVSAAVESPDAIVSLASHEWERLPAAAELAARFPSARVLLTRPTEVTIHNCHDCANRVHRLALAGVEASRVWVLQLTMEGTRGEAEVCRRLADELGFRRILVVTSPYHTRRALAVFRRAFEGSRVQIGVEPAFRYSEARPLMWWASPHDRWYVAYEWAALAYYALFYKTWPAFDVSDAAA